VSYLTCKVHNEGKRSFMNINMLRVFLFFFLRLFALEKALIYGY